MTFEDFLHAVRAVADVASTDELLVFGSHAILAMDSDPPAELRQSFDLDVFLLKHPERSDMLNGPLGEDSPFHATHGFYVHGLGYDTVMFPANWESRQFRRAFGRPPVTVVCPEIHDLAAAKLAAGRDKDFDYVSVLLQHKYVKPRTLLARIRKLSVADDLKERLRQWVGAVARTQVQSLPTPQPRDRPE